jgi:hypothetical protein
MVKAWLTPFTQNKSAPASWLSKIGLVDEQRSSVS